MSTDVTMQELELESAELLPTRETNVIGNTSQFGLINVSAFNGVGNTLLAL